MRYMITALRCGKKLFTVFNADALLAQNSVIPAQAGIQMIE
jgi:hypothetical protein